MASCSEEKLTENEKKLFVNILKMMVDILQYRKLEPEDERDPNDLYCWFQACKDGRSSAVLTDGLRILNCQDGQEGDKLMNQLRDHLLLHKWQDALNVLELLSKTPLYRNHYVLLRVGLELIYRLKCGSQSFDGLAEFVKKDPGGGLGETLNDLFNFKLITRLPEGITRSNGGHVILDEISDLVAVNKNKNVKPKHQEPIEIASELMHNYYYPGLVAYVKWNVVRLKLHSVDYSDDEARNELNKAAEKAVLCFSECEKYEGVWDGVVSKHVEILEYHARADVSVDLLQAAESVLLDYEKSCPANPNAPKMIYHFYERNADTFDRSLAKSALVEICRRCPSDDLVLKLASSEDGGFSRLELLFDFLDHHVRKNNEPAWGMLAEELVGGLANAEKRGERFEEIRKCWMNRSEWWPEYHFQEWTQFESVELDLCKAAVALVLLGKRCTFYKEVVRAARDSSVVSERFDLLCRARALGISLDGPL